MNSQSNNSASRTRIHSPYHWVTHRIYEMIRMRQREKNWMSNRLEVFYRDVYRKQLLEATEEKQRHESLL